ncbi:DnaJ C-terminal domain-containing protein [Undibacterium sp. SXout7W]|uniref:DnaJ C-terminal domain-containing protein n=1 Tax=Undibacterium sp. SXout7W TaxID=3413049 RepID=UPI003BF43205
MKYKDYYEILGLDRSATLDDVKTAYRKLAHLYHPDISKDPKGEEKFKEIAEAYATLKNTEKRADYDMIGSHKEGENFTPPPAWQAQYNTNASSFDDVDISDFFSTFRSRGKTTAYSPAKGEDYSIPVSVPLETIFQGGAIDVSVELPEYDQHGLPHRRQHTFRITILKGAQEGQRLRLTGKGGAGRNGGQPGDLYAILTIASHHLFRVNGSDLYVDLPLSPWEAALGANIQIPTPGGNVELKITSGTSSGQRLRLSKRGLPKADGQTGDLYAVVQIQIPKEISKAEQDLYQQLSRTSHFQPRTSFDMELK